MFLDGPDAKARDAVRIVFAHEKVKQEYLSPSPAVTESVLDPQAQFRHVDLEPLVRMKLNSFRNVDCTHIRDMISIGLLDAVWPARFEPALAARLQELLDDQED